MTRIHHEQGFAARLQTIIDDMPEEGLTLGNIFDRLAESAYGGCLILLAAPCCIPFLYVLPQIMALPIAAVALQMAAGRHTPWLPDALAAKVIDKTSLANTARRIQPLLGWLEAAATARGERLLARPWAKSMIGVLLLIFSFYILLPLPGTNTVPGIAILITAVGLLEKDGWMVGAGLALGMVWAAVLLLAALIGGLWIFGLVNG